jgi:hypothetical protein
MAKISQILAALEELALALIKVRHGYHSSAFFLRLC